MNMNIFMVGVGGQGVLTIAELLVAASIARGLDCIFYPTKGMAQRGGFVKAQLRIGEKPGGPDISLGGADIVIAMEQNEALKAVPYLKQGGDMIVYGYRWLPTDAMLGRAPYPDATQVEAAAQTRQACYTYVPTEKLMGGGGENIFLLSASQKHTALKELFSAEELFAAVTQRFPKFVESNKNAFRCGQQV
ncbi:MAG: 2-oxoacid:acceptor oxidoreductase family protein [Clostridiales bacterium]|jgi:indolepyruvate ferredoxin oxidoreductase beta subunit|nr:2-oxoacid:acceptor oxidoreductase family protein [Clostridiales bacterium]